MADHSPRIDDLRRRVLRDPASIAFAQLAEEYRRAGALEEAVEVCRAGLARHAGYLSARVTLGRALLELGQLDAALEELNAVLAGAPDNLAAVRGLGEIAHRRGQLKEALGHYRRALGLARNDPDLQQLVADLTRIVARVPAGVASPSAPAVQKPDAVGLLTLEQLTQELQQHPIRLPSRSPSPAAAPADGQCALLDPAQSADDHQTVATLERWLTAIDGFRAERRA